MNIAILSDIHLPTLTPQKLNPLKLANTKLNNFHAHRLYLLIDEIKASKPAEVWIIGDLLDTTNINLVTLKVLKDFIISLGVPVKYLNGNHERITNEDYLLDFLDLPWTKLPTHFKILNTTFTAINHKDINSIYGSPSSDILLSHFRWALPTFWGKKAELSTRDLTYITKNFKHVILGDVHSEYEPEPNIMYINQPFTTKYVNPAPKGFILLNINLNGYTITRIHTNLPNKIRLETTLDGLNDILHNISSRHLYKIEVQLNIMDVDKLPTSVPTNVKLVPNLLDTKNVQPIQVNSSSIIDTLLSILPTTHRPYIKEIIC